MNLGSYKSYKRFLFGLGIAGLSLVLGVFAFYGREVQFCNLFGPAEWGQFGDFVGGITNPLLAFLTFIGVLWTIALTYEERKEQSLQDKKTDIFRVIEIIHSECLEILATARHFMRQEHVFQKKLSECLKTKIYIGDEEAERFWVQIEEAFEGELQELKYKLYMLKELLAEFENLSQNYYVSDYYKVFYASYIMQLFLAGTWVAENDLRTFYTDVVHDYAKLRCPDSGAEGL